MAGMFLRFRINPKSANRACHRSGKITRIHESTTPGTILHNLCTGLIFFREEKRMDYFGNSDFTILGVVLNSIVEAPLPDSVGNFV
jgi:hypothetical protein